MSSFWKAFAATAVPLSALAIVSFTGHLPEFMMGVTAICFMLVVAVAVVVAVMGRRRAAAGIFTGLAAGVLVLAVTCFASLVVGQPA